MIINILNIPKFISDNGCKEVTSLQYFESNTAMPKDNGLISYDIFGLPGTEDRRTRYGYISLQGTFMNPHVMYVFRRLKMRILEDMVNGLGRYYVDHRGQLVKLVKDKPIPETVDSYGTGMDWLKSVWDKIDWKPKKGDSRGGSERKAFMDSLSIDDVFIDKYIVIPAYYRDMDVKKTKKNEINTKFYERMISLAEIVKNTDPLITDDWDIPVTSVAAVKMQNLLFECYNYFMDMMAGMNGFIHKYVMGKRSTYGSRLVISAANYNVETPEELDVDFHHTGLPLAVGINQFSPFMIHAMVRFIESYIAGARDIYMPSPDRKTMVKYELSPDYMEQFSVKNIKRILRLFERSKLYRIEDFTILDKDNKEIPLFYKIVSPKNKDYVNICTGKDISEEQLNDSHVEIKPLKNIELMYMLCHDVCKDKHVYVTRYPVLDINGTYPSKINIIPCKYHGRKYIKGQVYPRFPILDGITPDNVDSYMIDSLNLFTTYIHGATGLGGDFDGDQVAVQSVFTKEANEDCDRQIKSNSNIIGIDGSITRVVPEVSKHGLYGLTYRV